MCCSFNFQGRNVRPSDETLVIAAGRPGIQMHFGFRLADGRLVINARSETALEKTLFRESLLCRRIAIPADCFHEWDKDKVKYTFTRPDGRQMYLAGICGKSCFVIHCQSTSTCRRRKRRQEKQALGRSRGGFSTKIHALSDALGNPLQFILTGGGVSDYLQALPLLLD